MTPHHRDLSTQAVTERLRSLPDSTAAPYGWTEFKQRRQRRRDLRRSVAAIAAGFALIVASLALWSRYEGAGEWAVNDGAVDGPALFVGSASWPAESESSPLLLTPAGHAVATSQWLASLPSEPIIVRVGTRVAVTDLEDRIAWLDDLLTTAEVEHVQPTHIMTLRRERAQLVDSLAQVRYAETLAADLP